MRLARATFLIFVSIGAVMSIARRGLSAGRDLLHVDARPRIEHRAPLGDRDHGKRVGLAPRHQAGSVDRIDGDIHDRRVARAEPLAVEQHRCLVLLALTDHDDAIQVHRVEYEPHRVDGRLVGGNLVSPANPARCAQRGGLGGSDQIQRQVGIGAGQYSRRRDHGASFGAAESLSWLDGPSPFADMGIIISHEFRTVSQMEMAKSFGLRDCSRVFHHPILSDAASTPKLSLGGSYWLRPLGLPECVDAPNAIPHRCMALRTKPTLPEWGCASTMEYSVSRQSDQRIRRR